MDAAMIFVRARQPSDLIADAAGQNEYALSQLADGTAFQVR